MRPPADAKLEGSRAAADLRCKVLAAIVTLIVPVCGRPADSARIYVYAERPTLARSWLTISCDGAVVAKLKQGWFFAVNVAPGRHVVATETGVPALVEARSGEEYFARLDWHIETGHPAIPQLHVVPAAQARREMKYLSYVPRNKVLSSSVPMTDPSDVPPPQLKSRGER